MTSPLAIEAAIARLDALPDATARQAAREALSVTLAFHGDALSRLSKRLQEAGGAPLLEAAAEDELVAAMLSLHGVHPRPIEARVRRALEALGETVEVLSLDHHLARLRLTGDERLRLRVVQAVETAAPEIETVEVLSADPSLVPASRLVRTRDRSHERCEVCSAALSGPEHDHLLDLDSRQLRCACGACAVLFDDSNGALRRIRRQFVRLDDFRIDDAEWEALGVPVGLVFFVRSSRLGAVVASYPGPAGAVESVISEETWNLVVGDHSLLATLAQDTSALLAVRNRPPPHYYVVSIDECYRLTAVVRRAWEGITGGAGPARAVEAFLADRTEQSS